MREKKFDNITLRESRLDDMAVKPENRVGADAIKEVCPCCSKRTKTRSEKEYKDLMNRLSRIEGQIRGIKGMMEKDAYCTDILTQVSAVTAALNSFNKVLLSQHMKTCVIEDIKQGKEETIDDLLATLQKLMK